MFDSKAMSKLSEPSEIPDLDQRLGLYRVFLKLYEHHRELLDEILDLENSDHRSHASGSWQFVQGVIHPDQVYLMTNLNYHKTQMLTQSQNCWVIGRDRNSGIAIPDKRLSRRHAVVHYVDGQGFFLMDLNSTNGSYVNGEPVRRPTLLKDGDRIRLGSLSFIFFLCHGGRHIDALPTGFLQDLEITPLPTVEPNSTRINSLDHEGELLPEGSLAGGERETSVFLNAVNAAEDNHSESVFPDLTSAQKADILDRFLNRS